MPDVPRIARDVARALTEKYKRGQTTEMRELLVQIQTTIDAIDRAIADEKNMTSMPAQMAPGVKIGTTDKE